MTMNECDLEKSIARWVVMGLCDVAWERHRSTHHPNADQLSSSHQASMADLSIL